MNFTSKRECRSRRRRAVLGVILSAMLACGVCAGGMSVAYADTTGNVTINDNGQEYTISSDSSDIDSILQQAGITLEDDDLVDMTTNSDGIKINISRAVTLTLNVNGNTVEATGFAGDTVEEIMNDNGISVGDTDSMDVSKDSVVTGDTKATVQKMLRVTINDGGTKKECVVPEGTVKEALAAVSISLGKNDSVANGDAQVKDGMTIKITRVTYKTTTKTKTIDYKTVEKKTSDLAKGETEIETYGQEGEKVITYQVKYVNGKKTSTKKLKTEVTAEAVDQVVLVGTKKTTVSESLDAVDSAVEETNSAIEDTNSTTGTSIETVDTDDTSSEETTDTTETTNTTTDTGSYTTSNVSAGSGYYIEVVSGASAQVDSSGNDIIAHTDSALTVAKGAIVYNGHRETYYSQKVLPGTALNIPGRHTASDGTVRDGDGFICVANNDVAKGTVITTSLGLAKVYDTGCPSGTVDIYTNW